MAPSWFGTSASESHHPIIQSSRLQTNPPKLEVTQQQDFMTRQDPMCLGPRNSVMSTFNAPSKPRVRNKSPQVKLGWYDFNTRPYCARILISRPVESLHAFSRAIVNRSLSEGRREAVKLEMIWAINLFRLV